MAGGAGGHDGRHDGRRRSPAVGDPVVASSAKASFGRVGCNLGDLVVAVLSDATTHNE